MCYSLKIKYNTNSSDSNSVENSALDHGRKNGSGSQGPPQPSHLACITNPPNTPLPLPVRPQPWGRWLPCRDVQLILYSILPRTRWTHFPPPCSKTVRCTLRCLKQLRMTLWRGRGKAIGPIKVKQKCLRAWFYSWKQKWFHLVLRWKTYSYHLDFCVKYKNINEKISTAFSAIKMLLISEYI